MNRESSLAAVGLVTLGMNRMRSGSGDLAARVPVQVAEQLVVPAGLLGEHVHNFGIRRARTPARSLRERVAVDRQRRGRDRVAVDDRANIRGLVGAVGVARCGP